MSSPATCLPCLPWGGANPAAPVRPAECRWEGPGTPESFLPPVSPPGLVPQASRSGKGHKSQASPRMGHWEKGGRVRGSELCFVRLFVSLCFSLCLSLQLSLCVCLSIPCCPLPASPLLVCTNSGFIIPMQGHDCSGSDLTCPIPGHRNLSEVKVKVKVKGPACLVLRSSAYY